MASFSLNDYLKEAQAIAPKAIEIRRIIHQAPELGNEETATSALIEKTLTDLDLEVSRPMGTSVVALLRGANPGKTIAFRADMDALPIQEESNLPFKSQIPGKMHACGHDIHVAGLLGTAMVLTKHRNELHGNVKFLFQPDEENNGGAQRMIAAGCMENPHVDAVFGAHVDPDIPTGHIGFKYGKAYAASDMFIVTINGAGCHGASPHDGIDVIAIGAQVVTAIQQLVSRRTAPTDSAVVTVGSFQAGSAGNVIAQQAVLRGILRTLGSEMRMKIRKLFVNTVEGICAAMGASADVQIIESYPGVVNWDEMVDFSKNIAEDMLGRDKIHIFQTPTMGTEDFGYFIQEVPGAFYKIGVGNPDIGADRPIHSPNFVADENALSTLIGLHAAIAAGYLQ